MIKFFKLILFLLIFTVIVFLPILSILYRDSYDYTQQINTKKYGSIHIYRDKQFGIPNIVSKDFKGTLFGLGWCQAEDRLWQMNFMRMLSQGRLSELFGEKAIKIDKYYRTLGFARSSKKNLEHLSNSTLESLIAFADGVNSYVEEKMKLLPYEFVLLQTKFEKWTPLDSQTLLSFYYYDLHSDWRLEYYKTEIFSAYGKDLADEVFDTKKYWKNEDYPCILDDEDLKQSNLYDPIDENYLNSEEYKKQQEKRIDKLMKIQWDFIGHATLKGSNSWVIGGQHTQSGKPILCNDPHLDNFIPSVWYSTQLIFGKNKEHFLHGVTMPGIATLFLGRSNYMSWGATTINTGDNSDLYYEKLNKDRTQYLFEGKYQDLKIVEEEIKIKGQEPLIHQIRITKSGRPIISDFLQKMNTTHNLEVELSIQVGCIDENDYSYEGMQSLIMTNSWEPEKIKKYAAMVTMPNQNLIFATIDNHIGYYALSNMRKKETYVDDGYIKDGTAKLYEQQEKIPPNEKPFVFDPPKGYIVSSNQKFATNNIKHHKSYNAIPYTNRAYRINEMIQNLINSGKKITTQDMMQIQADYLDTFARKLLPLLLQQLKLIKSTEEYRIKKLSNIIDLLSKWDYKMNGELPESSIYMQWIDFIYSRFWEKIENPKERKEFQTSKYLEHYYWYYFTKNFNNTQLFVLDALEETIDKLEVLFGSSDYKDWKWKEIHYQYYRNPLFSQIKQLKPFFERTVPAHGNQHTPSVAVPQTYKGEFYSFHSGNYKAIYDMNYEDKSYFVIDSGISGNIFSKHYDDQLQLHKNYQFIEMKSGFSQLEDLGDYHESVLEIK